MLPRARALARRTLLFGLLAGLTTASCLVVLASAARSGSVQAWHHSLAQGSVHATTIYDSAGTEVYPPGAGGVAHGTIRWELGGKYASTRKTYALFGMRLVEGRPGRMFDFHTQPADEPWGWTPPGCRNGMPSYAVAPVAIDYFDERGLEVVVEPNNYTKCGGTGKYHYRIMSPAEVESRRGQWIYLWMEIRWGRVDGSTPTAGGVKVWVAGEDRPRVNRQGINTHWFEQGMVTFWQTTYWCERCGRAPTNISVEYTAPRFGRTPREAYEDVPTLYGQWGSKVQDGWSPQGDGWNTFEIAPRPSNEPKMPKTLRSCARKSGRSRCVT